MSSSAKPTPRTKAFSRLPGKQPQILQFCSTIYVQLMSTIYCVLCCRLFQSPLNDIDPLKMEYDEMAVS